jgi:hypothetical protein
MEEEEHELREKVQQILAEAEQVDEQEDAQYGKQGKAEALPAPLGHYPGAAEEARRGQAEAGGRSGRAGRGGARS